MRPRTPIWRSPIAVVTALALIAGLGLILALGKGAPAESSTLNVPATSYDPALVAGEALGRAQAPVTMEIWSDFQCPFCGKLARTYLPSLVTDFVDSGQLRLVTRDVAFVGRGDPDESAMAAIAATCAAEQGKYWQYHDMLFWNQIGENQGAFAEARLRQMADEVGLGVESWDRCRADPAAAKAVAATTSAAFAAGIEGTPTLVLNGAMMKGMPPTYEALAEAVRSALASVSVRP